MWMDNWVLNTPIKYWPLYKKNNTPAIFRFFETKRKVVVLSSSNKAETEANVAFCEKENIPIIRRKGGGGTVVLGPGCLVLTFAFYAKDVFGNSKYFNMINELWIQSIQPYVPVTLLQNGISDICAGKKKIAGTSIFRKKHLLVYQGSMLVDMNLEFMSQVLSHPSKEPEYRQGRPHTEFLTTLKQLDCTISSDELAVNCQKYFILKMEKYFQDEFYSLPHSH